MRRLLALSLVCALFGGGCRSARPKVERTLEVPSTLQISAIAFEPIQFRWEEPPWRTLELTQRMIDAAIAEANDRAYIFATYEGVSESGKKGDLAPVLNMLPRYALNPDELIVVRPWAEARIFSGQTTVKDADTGQGVGKSRSEDLTYVGHLEVYTSRGRGAELAEFSAELHVDPLEATDEVPGDPAPELTRLMTLLTQKAIESLAPNIKAPASPARAERLKVAFLPQHTWSYSEDGKPPLEATMAKADLLDRELAARNRVQYANPEVKDSDLDKFVSSPGGLYVLEGDEATGLLQGDLIIAIDGAPPLPQALARARMAPSSAELRVRRGLEDTVVVLR